MIVYKDIMYICNAILFSNCNIGCFGRLTTICLIGSTKLFGLLHEQSLDIATVTTRVDMVELVSARINTTMSACVRNVDVPASHHYLTVP